MSNDSDAIQGLKKDIEKVSNDQKSFADATTKNLNDMLERVTELEKAPITQADFTKFTDTITKTVSEFGASMHRLQIKLAWIGGASVAGAFFLGMIWK